MLPFVVGTLSTYRTCTIPESSSVTIHASVPAKGSACPLTSAGLLAPVFDAGRLKAGQRAAEARYEQGAAEYVKAVLDAFADVERALLTRELQLDRREREITFLTEARATQRVAQNRYVKGLVNYLDVLNAQITRYQAEDNLVLVDLTILRNRVALHRALGGSWAEPEALKIKDDGIFFRF